MRFWKVPVHIANKVPEGSGTKTFQDLKKLLGITHGFVFPYKIDISGSPTFFEDSPVGGQAAMNARDARTFFGRGWDRKNKEKLIF